jgi:hypothetical protein
MHRSILPQRLSLTEWRFRRLTAKRLNQLRLLPGVRSRVRLSSSRKLTSIAPPCEYRLKPRCTGFRIDALVFVAHLFMRAGRDGHWYLAEGYSCCYRARQCGFRIMADTTIRLLHVGTCAYGWEDAGGGRPQRQGTYQITD